MLHKRKRKTNLKAIEPCSITIKLEKYSDEFKTFLTDSPEESKEGGIDFMVPTKELQKNCGNLRNYLNSIR